MAPARTLLLCAILLIGGAAAPVEAGGWTASIGHYSRTLEQMRCAEREAEVAAGPTVRSGYNWNHPAFDGYAPSLYEYAYGHPYGYGYYPFGRPHFYGLDCALYLDRMHHRDYRYLNRRVSEVMRHSFPRGGHTHFDLRSPDFYIQHRTMERHLERRHEYRNYYYGRYRGRYFWRHHP